MKLLRAQITSPKKITKNPLSFAQQRLWFLDQLEPGNPAYNIVSAHRLTGSLNITVLEQSLKEIVKRHEVLRTSFAVINGQPVQFVDPSIDLSLNIIDLQKLSEIKREAEVERLINEDTLRPFDLTQGPLLRITLLQLSAEEHVLLLTIHHIISDGWSMSIFFKELAILYEAFSADKPSPLPELPIQYADFVVWQQQWLQGERLKKQLTYWKRQLDGNPSVLELPTDQPRSATQTFRGAKQSLLLPKTLSQAIKHISFQEKTTPFMTLLAAFKILLYRYTRQNDIVVGAPVAGRIRSEIEGLIGFFLNSLVLRTNLSGRLTFYEVLKKVRKVALEAYEHQDVPFERLLEEIKPERRLSHTPMFQVFFNMLTLSPIKLKLPGLTVEPVPQSEIKSNFDLTVYVKEQNEQIELTWVYSTDLFSEARIVEMAQQYEYLLWQIIENPCTHISQFSLVTPHAKQYLPDPTQPLQADWKGSIHNKFTQQARQHPKHIAVMDWQDIWTYQELEVRSNQLAHYLRAKGIRNQDLVAIYGHRSASLVWALLGILKAGAAFMILDPAHPTIRLKNYLHDANPHGWIYIEAAGQLPDELKEFITSLSFCFYLTLPTHTGAKADNFLSNYSTDEPDVVIEPEDLAYIAFTSGSLGRPKGVLGCHGSLSHFLPWQMEKFALNASDRFSMLSGLSHDPLQRDVFTALWVGATLCIPNPNNIKTPCYLAKWMAHESITFAHLTPALGQILTEVPSSNYHLSSLRYAFFIGDKLTRRDVARLRRLAPQVTCINSYGATETQRAVGYHIIPPEAELNQDKTKAVYHLGHGMPDVQLLVLNTGQQLAGVGELGEIYIRSPHLARGYLENQKLTEARFLINSFTGEVNDRLYRTGDLGRYLPDGNVEFVGRADRQVKIRGFRIEPVEIEEVLVQHPRVHEAIVVARDDVQSNWSLVAYLVGDQELRLSVEELRVFLKKRIPDYMIPVAFVMLKTLPLTPNGKVDYGALSKPAPLSLKAKSNTFLAPRDMMEQKLVTIWEDVLGVQPIDIRDNFFELGGHSLLAVRLFAKMAKVFNKDIPLVTLFQAPTIEQLVNILRDEGWKPLWTSLVPIQPHGSNPPFFCVHAVGGNALSLHNLARHLDTDQPFYALQSQGLDGKKTPPSRVEDMAAHYIEEIRTIQPEGPYFLGGQSSGGLIAFEMAQQLQAQEQQVAFLALIDTYGPDYRKLPITKAFRNKISFHLNAFLHFGPTYILKRLKSRVRLIKVQIQWTIFRLVKKFYASRNHPLPQAIRYIYVREAIRQALSNYEPKIYQGKITFFRATRTFQAYLENFQNYQRGWDKLAAEGVEIHDIPGEHNLEQDPYVGLLAKKLNDCLRKSNLAVYQQK